MGLLSKIFSNTRKPEGFFGRMMVNGMNGGGHARLAEWGLSHLTLTADANVLDVGCGGGANVARLLKRCPQRDGDGHRLLTRIGEEKHRGERRRHRCGALPCIGR